MYVCMYVCMYIINNLRKPFGSLLEVDCRSTAQQARNALGKLCTGTEFSEGGAVLVGLSRRGAFQRCLKADEGPVLRVSGPGWRKCCQSFAVEIEIDEREAGAESVMILRQTAVAHLVEAEDAFEDEEGMFYLRPHA